MRVLLLLVALLAVGCNASPVAPSQVDRASPAGASEPVSTPQTPTAPRAPVLTPPQPAPEIAVPTWQQTILNNIVMEMTDTATRETKSAPGLVVYFEITAIDRLGGTHIAGELRNPRQPRSGMGLVLSYTLVKDALDFPDKATFLLALQTAVTYKAEVRLVGGSITCCLQKPASAVTGRFEGDF